MSATRKQAARGGRNRADAPGPQTEEATAPTGELPDASSLLHDTFAEGFDPSAGQQDADSVPTGEVRFTLAQLEEIQKAMRESGQLSDRSKTALAAALADIYAAGIELYAEPARLFACLSQAGIRWTRATTNSAFLLIVKLALTEIEAKTQSFYARTLNYCAALDLDRDGAEAAILEHGTVELARREAKRQKARRGEPAGESDAEAAARFRAERRAVPLADVEFGTSDFALLIVGRDGDAVVAFDIDDNDKRLNAAIRAALKRGAQTLGADTMPAGGDGEPEVEADAA